MLVQCKQATMQLSKQLPFTTPFQALYGYPPPNIEVYSTTTPVAAMEKVIQRRQYESVIQVAIEKLQKQMVDKAITGIFKVGGQVYLKLLLYKQMSLAWRKNMELNPRFYEPYKAIQKVGEVAYKMQVIPLLIGLDPLTCKFNC